MSKLVGVGLVGCGCACAATGLLLMKASTVYEGHKPPFCRWRWLLGFTFLGVLTTVIDVYVLGILPLSVVAPFAGLTIVFSLLIAQLGLVTERELMSRTDVYGALLILLGVTLISTFGPESSAGVAAADIMADFQKPFFAAFASTTLLTVGWWVSVLVLPCLRRCHPGPDSAVATALSAWSAAVCGALSQLFVKVVAVTLHEAEGDFTSAASPWRTSGAPYLALSGLIFTAPMQLYLLDQALRPLWLTAATACCAIRL